MALVSDTDLKGYFKTGDKPTQQQFANLIDSKRSKLDKILMTDLHQDIVDILNNAGSGDTNLGNTNLTLDDDRSVNCNNHWLSFENAIGYVFDGEGFVIPEIVVVDKTFKSVNLGDIYNSVNGTKIEILDAEEKLNLYGTTTIKSLNSTNDFVDRLLINTANDIVAASFKDVDLSLEKTSNNSRLLLASLTDSLVMLGDVDRVGYSTQLWIADDGQQIGLLANEGILIQAKNSGGTGYALVKTDNITEGEATLQLPAAYGKTLAISVNGVDADASGNVELPVTVKVLNQTHLGNTASRFYATESTAGKYRICVYLKILTIHYGDDSAIIQLYVRYNDENGVSVTHSFGVYGAVGMYIFSPIDILTDGSRCIEVFYDFSDGTTDYNSSCTIEKII